MLVCIACNFLNNCSEQRKIRVAIFENHVGFDSCSRMFLNKNINEHLIGKKRMFFSNKRLAPINIIGQAAAVAQQKLYCDSFIWKLGIELLNRIVKREISFFNQF